MLCLAGAATTQSASAAIPSLETVGYEYYNYLYFANEATPGAISADAALAATLPYGINIGYTSYFNFLATSTSNTYENGANAVYYYYKWLGEYYAYQNYIYPDYAENLQTFYTSYGNDQYNAIFAAGAALESYYQAAADYYYGQAFPQS